MPSSIARLVRDDHERIPRLLHRVVSPGPSRQRWRAELVRLVRAHRAAERELLTPEVAAPAGPAATAAVHELRELDAELDAALRALDQVALDSVSVPGLGERLAVLLDRHAGLTDDVLRALEDAVPRKQLRLLGGAFSQVREDILRDDGVAAPPPRRLDLPRAELYELARKAGIEGRSAMSRGQLIAALQRPQEPASS